MQVLQTADEVAPNAVALVPAGHARHWEPPGLYEPGLHAAHVVTEEAISYGDPVPAAHLPHAELDVAPTVAL